MNILCNCGSYHETTEAFDPDKRPHGGMFRLKEPYRSNGWESFPEHEGVTGDALECPQCGAPYGYPVRVDGDWKRMPSSVLLPQTPEGAAEVKERVDARYGEGTADAVAENALILKMHREGFRPKEVAEKLGLSSHMKVVARLRAMGEK